MDGLFLADLAGLSEEQVKEHLISNYEAEPTEVAQFRILIGYESGSWGCDSSSWFLLKDTKGQLFEVHGGHCSCYGFESQIEGGLCPFCEGQEDQFKPEETTLKYLVSDKFHFCCGGWDDDDERHRRQVTSWLQKFASGVEWVNPDDDLRVYRNGL